MNAARDEIGVKAVLRGTFDVCWQAIPYDQQSVSGYLAACKFEQFFYRCVVCFGLWFSRIYEGTLHLRIARCNLSSTNHHSESTTNDQIRVRTDHFDLIFPQLRKQVSIEIYRINVVIQWAGQKAQLRI
jgi:hypothetical protein